MRREECRCDGVGTVPGGCIGIFLRSVLKCGAGSLRVDVSYVSVGILNF